MDTKISGAACYIFAFLCFLWFLLTVDGLDWLDLTDLSGSDARYLFQRLGITQQSSDVCFLKFSLSVTGNSLLVLLVASLIRNSDWTLSKLCGFLSCAHLNDLDWLVAFIYLRFLSLLRNGRVMITVLDLVKCQIFLRGLYLSLLNFLTIDTTVVIRLFSLFQTWLVVVRLLPWMNTYKFRFISKFRIVDKYFVIGLQILTCEECLRGCCLSLWPGLSLAHTSASVRLFHLILIFKARYLDLLLQNLGIKLGLLRFHVQQRLHISLT